MVEKLNMILAIKKYFQAIASIRSEKSRFIKLQKELSIKAEESKFLIKQSKETLRKSAIAKEEARKILNS